MPDKPQNEHKEGKSKSESYRLVILRSEDFHEIRSFDLTLGNVYVISSVVILLLVALLAALVIFTPVKRLIPGYGQIEVTQDFMQLVNGVDELNSTIDAQGTYIDALRRLLSSGLSQEGKSGRLEVNSNNVSTRELIASNSISNAVSSEDVGNPLLEGVNTMWNAIQEDNLHNPVAGIISSEFDPGLKHFGVDILAPAQTPIVTIMDGFVFSSGWDLETGYTIGIQHEGNFLSFYKHNSQLLKEKGTFVQAGEAVAIIGNTGTLSNGPHLHFELWHNGKPINPVDILNFN